MMGWTDASWFSNLQNAPYMFSIGCKNCNPNKRTCFLTLMSDSLCWFATVSIRCWRDSCHTEEKEIIKKPIFCFQSVDVGHRGPAIPSPTPVPVFPTPLCRSDPQTVSLYPEQWKDFFLKKKEAETP